MMQWSLLLYALLMMVGLMTLVWLVYRRTDRPDIVDVAWAFGLALIAVVFASVGHGWWVRKLLMALMAGCWGLRLAFHLAHRIRTHAEDGRYLQMRSEWKSNQHGRFFVFFQLQALLNVILSVPFAIIVSNPADSLHPVEWAAVFLFLVALYGETVADRQLRLFKGHPANGGKVCRTGLWKYSRHPNYFFEWLVWVSYALFALASTWGAVAIVAPLLMLYFLLRVTGIPATEAQSLRTKGDAYREYQKTTSVFFPWFPLREGHTN